LIGHSAPGAKSFVKEQCAIYGAKPAFPGRFSKQSLSNLHKFFSENIREYPGISGKNALSFSACVGIMGTFVIFVTLPSAKTVALPRRQSGTSTVLLTLFDNVTIILNK
jgi:hypothetical protein